MPKPGPRRKALSEDHLRDLATRCFEMAQAGMTDVEIAQELNVSVMQLYRWRQQNPELDESLQLGKRLPDERVIGSIHKMATGYDYEEEQAIKISDAAGNESVEVVTVKKHQPANTSAAIFWAKNRRRSEWSDQQSMDVNMKVEAPTDVTQLALALLATLQAGIAAPKTIEHEESDNDD